MLEKARAFFKERGLLEADTAMLSPYSNLDNHIDPIAVTFMGHQKGYLHTSPEPCLKKLLAHGVGDVYFLGHVFRDFEKGHRHHLEFTMAEWYRHELTFDGLIDETLDFIRLFVGEKEAQIKEYRDLFYEKTNLWVEKATKEELLDCIALKIDASMSFEKESQTDLEVFIFSNLVEPALEEEGLIVVRHYPEGQAALAKTEIVNGVKVAKRFEIYDQGLELANGYDELKGSQELRMRYEASNALRLEHGKPLLPIDFDFLAANEHLPDCRGVSVGFDRAFMLHMNYQDIAQVQIR